MRKRILVCLLVVATIMTTLIVPMTVSAADFSTYSDFENYTGKWNGVDNFACVLPVFPNVAKTKCSPATLDEYSGITNGTAADSKYGNSLKIVQKPNENASSNVYTMVHFDEVITGSIYMEASMYVEKSATGLYSSKSIRFNTDTGAYYPVRFDEAMNITVFGKGTGVSWSPDEWYDIKIWYNIETGAHIAKIYNDGQLLIDITGITSVSTEIRRVLFYMNAHCKNSTVIAAGENVTYFDNFRLENTDKVIIDEMTSLSYFNFEEWDDEKGLPDTLGMGVWKKGLGGSGKHEVKQIDTDRGKSLKICSMVSETDAEANSNKNDHFNPALFFNYGTKISTAAALKVSFMLPDDNFHAASIMVANNLAALTAKNGGNIYSFDGVDTGMDTRLNTWYDLEVVVDYDTGYYNYYLTDGIFEYKADGFSNLVANKRDEAYLYRTWFRLTAKMDNRYYLPADFIIDDFYYGPVSKLSAPLYGAYDGKAKLNLPFKNTKYRYTADVNIADLSKDVVLTSVGTRVVNKVTTEFSYDTVKFGADGKLYIGETAVADITSGAYDVEAVVDQKNFNAAVKVTKEGATVGEGVVALGDGAILMKSMNWNVDDGDSIIGDVEYRGIYDFALDNVNTSKGIIGASEAVVARFTNALDRDSFTATVNDGEVASEVTFIDDNTVKIDFVKTPGSVYTIRFTDVKDLFGNTVSDYTRVTMAEEGGVYFSNVQFTKNGETIDVTQPGELSATVSAAAYGGNEDINFTLALYEGGRMVDCDFKNFTATENLEEHSLKVNVPDDGKHYVAKTYIQNSETLEAYTQPAVLEATKLPVIILKLDGIGVDGRLDAFMPSYEYAVENGIKMNFGVIARDLDSTNTEDIEKLYEMEKHEMIEFWNHQYGAGNMGKYTREQIFADFEKAKIASEKTGIVYETFNSIENYVHSDIADALNAYNYKAVLSRADECYLAYHGYLDENNTYTTLWRTFDVEKGASGTLEDGTVTSRAYTVCIPVEDMIADWETAIDQDWPYAVLQYHPGNWPISDLTTSDGKVYSSDYMYDFIEYLEDEGVIFMTATEYVDYMSVIH